MAPPMAPPMMHLSDPLVIQSVNLAHRTATTQVVFTRKPIFVDIRGRDNRSACVILLWTPAVGTIFVPI